MVNRNPSNTIIGGIAVIDIEISADDTSVLVFAQNNNSQAVDDIKAQAVCAP